MDRIIFDNVQRGFPANEKFMQIVDKNRLALLEVCRGIFGDRPTILKGVEPTIISENQGKKQISISSGVVWTGGDLVNIKESQVETADPDRTLAVIINHSKEKGKFHDGNEYDAYIRNEGRVAATGSLLDERLLRNYTRSNITQSVSTKINLSSSKPSVCSVSGSLQQTVFSNGIVNVCGMARLVVYWAGHSAIATEGVKVAQLSVRNADVGKNGLLPYPAAIMFSSELSEEESPDGKKRSISHFVKLTSDGSLYVYIPTDKLMSSPQLNPPIPSTYFVSVNINFNSEI